MENPLAKACPRCGEPRILAPECSRCGVLYAWAGDLEDARSELRLRLFALPAALALAWLLVNSPMWGFLLRTFLSMWIHELGHAVTAWFCGFPSMPGPWVTRTSDERSTVVFLVLATLLAGLLLRGYLTRSRGMMIAGATGLVLQFIGTQVLSPWKGLMLVTFGGDGGCLVLGSLLMTTLYAPRDSKLRQGWLHWGYLSIGAAAFMDSFSEWWAARTDFARIPFGEMEGVGLSDASKLVEVYRWDELELIRRYTGLGLACLAALAVLYGVGLLRARARLRALEDARGPA